MQHHFLQSITLTVLYTVMRRMLFYNIILSRVKSF